MLERVGLAVGSGCEQRKERQAEDVDPAHQQVPADGCGVVPVFGGQPAAPFGPGGQVVEAVVPVDRAGDFEAGGAEQPDPLADRAGDRDHGLGGDQAVIAGAGAGRVGDVVAEEVPFADGGRRDPE